MKKLYPKSNFQTLPSATLMKLEDKIIPEHFKALRSVAAGVEGARNFHPQHFLKTKIYLGIDSRFIHAQFNETCQLLVAFLVGTIGSDANFVKNLRMHKYIFNENIELYFKKIKFCVKNHADLTSASYQNTKL